MTDAAQGSESAPGISGPLSWLPRIAMRRRVLFAVAASVVGGGMALNWGWLTAIGAAPILVSLAPCAAMCGLGLCMKGGAGSSCSKKSAVPQSPID